MVVTCRTTLGRSLLAKGTKDPAPGAASNKKNEDMPEGYNANRAAMLAYVSAWSYSDVKTFQEKLQDIPEFAGANFLEVDVVNDSMFVVAYAQIIRTEDHKRAYISFRGTQLSNPVKWLTDMNTKKVPFHKEADDSSSNRKPIMVHSGFLRNFRGVGARD